LSRPPASALPSYREPPITEVVIGIAFKDAAGFSAAHAGDLWRTEWEPTFPGIEEHPPYLPPIERMDVPLEGPSISLELGDRPMTRIWFISSDGQEVIQVQRDWFACNWRKVKPGSEYDRWPKRRAAFETHVVEFESYIRNRGLGKVTPTQCEVTYVNHIVAGSRWTTHGQLDQVLRLASTTHDGFLPTPEQIQVAASYVISNEEESLGRLHVSAQPGALREDGTPIFVLNLTARGAPLAEGLEGALAFLDLGREWIVRGFAELTTTEMQDVWGRYA
jgi:uncharacterized protein (TIGR04255 family)